MVFDRKKFCCIDCNEHLTYCPSDEMHPNATRNKEDLMPENIIEIHYHCKKCKLVNIIYWGVNKIPKGLL
ncbi:MAG: hypothetical protein P8Y18_06650 [Candidatus Bathyarchaeota archaeon]